MKIGFIGIGAMGQPMLANVLKKGHSVVAYDVVETALDGAVKLGAARAGVGGCSARDGRHARDHGRRRRARLRGGPPGAGGDGLEHHSRRAGRIG